jgi:hypothetical protein
MVAILNRDCGDLYLELQVSDSLTISICTDNGEY